jgi:hypothetical protein
LSRCIAFVEKQVNVLGSKRYQPIIYVPCPARAKENGKRLCGYHARAYRELVLGIVMQGGGRALK